MILYILLIQYISWLAPTIGYKFEHSEPLLFQYIWITFVTINETSMNTRLKQFLSAENITQAQFADNINVVRASVSHVLSGRNNPSYEFIRSIMVNYPNLNIEWLMFGKGKMYKDASVPIHTKKIEEDILFPELEEEQLPDHSASYDAPIETSTTDEDPKIIVNQRKVSKVIILFDDGSYQEM